MKEHGHLFQDRFLSKRVEDREYLKNVCRYIHQNPAKAGICNIEEYSWSSYKEYVSKSKIINPKMLMSIFSDDKTKMKEEFIKYNKDTQGNEIHDFLEYEMKEKLTDEHLAKYICEIANVQNVYEILEYNKNLRDEILVKIKQNKKIKNAQISRVLGINKKMVERAK